MFENGSEWVRVDFHLHTKADKEFKFGERPEEFVKEYTEKLQKECIKLGVVTNHNKFDFEEFKSLRRASRKLGISLLPGVELSVNDGSNGIHCLIVFGDDWIKNGIDLINPFISTAFSGKGPTQFENENGRTNDNLITVLGHLEKTNKDYFVVFAHVEQRSGLWTEFSGGRIKELSKLPIIQERCLGFQKVRTHEKSGKACRVSVKNWWEGNYPAEVEGSDPKKIQDIGKGTQSSFLKLGALSFEAVKFALVDAQQRVRFTAPKNDHSWIKSISFSGGLLDGQKVSFSPNLNCLIGVRGSGKSAILECLRYTLEIPRGDQPEDLDYKKNLIPHIMESGGTAVVEICDTHGTTYEVSRTWKHAPIVRLKSVVQPDVSVNSTLLRAPLYFGQKDLAASGNGFGKDLVDKLIGPDLEKQRLDIQNSSTAVEKKVRELASVSADAETLAEKEQQRNDLVFRLDQFKKYNIEKKLEEQKSYNENSEHIALVSEIADDLKARLDEVVNEFDDHEIFDGEYETDIQKAIFKRLKTQVTALRKEVNTVKNITTNASSILNKISKIETDFETAKQKKETKFADAKKELSAELRKKGVETIDLDEYLDVAESKSQLDKDITTLTRKVGKQTSKSKELNEKIDQMSTAWLSEFQETEKLLKTINESQDALVVKVSFKENRQSFISHAKDVFAGSGLTTKQLEALAEKYVDFSEVYLDVNEAAKLFKAKAEVFKDLFIKNLDTFLTFQVLNEYEIVYQGKPLKSHSLGQRASAMILFVLAQMEKDVLIVDQPEDDLDNQTVYEDVVKLIQKQKPNKQFLLATHNANFPVLGDAEMIVSCAENDGTMATICEGIDAKDCQERIVSIMEGGPEAFKRRRTIYQLWQD